MPAQLQSYLHAQIPLSAAMGIEVAEASDEIIRLRAPLAPNINHRGTVFGGSLASIGTLACWCWLAYRLRSVEREDGIVVRRTKVEYLRPLSEAFQAVCHGPSPEAWEAFQKGLSRRGTARLHLHATVSAGEDIGAVLDGEFVAIA